MYDIRTALVLFASVVLMLSPSAIPAAAHPFTLESYPNFDRSAPPGITEVWVRYSEEVVVEFSSLKVYDQNKQQIDNRDTAYHTDSMSLVVTTPPLTDGLYTISSKVLSAVDGHLVPDTVHFAVGSAVIDPSNLEVSDDFEAVALPEAGAFFPGLVGQSVVVGSALVMIVVWRRLHIPNPSADTDNLHYGRLESLVGAALIAVFASNILLLVIQTLRLESFSLDIFQTTYGMVWIVRMALTVAMLALWFVIERGRRKATWHVMLALGLGLLWTSSQTGHGAATGEWMPPVLDFIHNVVAAVWIGGLIYALVILLPALRGHPDRQGVVLRMIPRLSTVFVLCLGTVIVTGPLLMWSLDNDIGRISGSLYGQLIMIKLALAGAMVGLAGYTQMSVIRKARQALAGMRKMPRAYDTLRRSLRYEAILGVMLLATVAVLVNGSLPAGYAPDTAGFDLTPDAVGLETTQYSANTRFDIQIYPYTTGYNGISVRASNLDGTPATGQTGISVKTSNPELNISPVRAEMASDGDTYYGDVVFGFAGQWLVDIESQRDEGGNEAVSMILPVKPNLDSMLLDINEFEFPIDANPRHPVYDDRKDVIWISDASAPRIWSFDVNTGQFEFYEFAGSLSLFLDMDSQGRVWFTDSRSSSIGYLDGDEFTLIPIPVLEPTDSASVILSILVDGSGDIWITVLNKDVILRYDPGADAFDVYDVEDEAFPFALAQGPDGNIWFTASRGGYLGYIEPDTGTIRYIVPDPPLNAPEALLFDGDQLWVSEHVGESLIRLDMVRDKLVRIPLNLPGGLPYGLVSDEYNNIWIAQHQADTVTAYDPLKKTIRHVPVPTNTSFIQFGTIDEAGRIWFVEEEGNKMMSVSLTGVPSLAAPPRPLQQPEYSILYAEVASPLMSAGILAASLFFVKSVRDRRFIDAEIARYDTRERAT